MFLLQITDVAFIPSSRNRLLRSFYKSSIYQTDKKWLTLTTDVKLPRHLFTPTGALSCIHHSNHVSVYFVVHNFIKEFQFTPNSVLYLRIDLFCFEAFSLKYLWGTWRNGESLLYAKILTRKLSFVEKN